VTINVLQGEREFAKDNRLLGTFNLEGIPPAPRGMPQIEVTFNVDVNGILTVSAKDLGTSKENKITVQNAGGLNKDEIEKMKREAELHAAEDKKRREAIDAKNSAEQLIYQTEKQLKEHGDKVSADIRGNIEGALNNLKEAVKSDDAERIKKAAENLQQASFKLGEEIYKSAAPKGAGPSPAPEAQTDRGTTEGGEKKKDEDVIDAEYEVKE
jgi:molecular chaperone DnaK